MRRWPLLVLALGSVFFPAADAQVAGTISKSTEGLTGLKVFGGGTRV